MMNTDFLDRGSAPFGDAVWARIDEAVIAAATSQLSARRLLELEGPHGLGLKSISGPDDDIETEGGATVCLSPAFPVPTIRYPFTVPMRDVADYETTGVAFNLRRIASAAIAMAHREDQMIFHGLPERGIPGLLNVPETASVHSETWTEPGIAFNNIVEAVNVLDSRGLHGPYSLALAPNRYNLLFRIYPQAGITEYEQLQPLIGGGIYKSAAINDGGVLIAAGKQFLSIVVGLDMVTGYVGISCGEYDFCLMESVLLKVSLPEAICVIGG